MEDTFENKLIIKKHLKSIIREFCNYIIETIPNYVDSDFGFDNFITWLEIKEENPTTLD